MESSQAQFLESTFQTKIRQIYKYLTKLFSGAFSATYLSIIDYNGKTYFLHQLSEPLATEHKAENITGYPSKCPSPIFKLLRILRGCQPRLQSTDEKFWWFLPLKSWSPKKETFLEQRSFLVFVTVLSHLEATLKTLNQER